MSTHDEHTTITPRRRGVPAIAGAVILAASLFGLSSSPVGADEGDGTMTISPSSGAVGTAVTVSGTLDSDCAPDRQVTVEIGELEGSRPDAMGATTATVIGSADSVGRDYTITGVIPDRIGERPGAATEPGVIGIHAYCYNPDISSFPMPGGSTTFTVTGEGGQGGPAVTLGASQVAAGGSVSFSADGFAPDSEVTVELHSDPVGLGTVRADASGHVAGTAVIPADTPAGAHELVLLGVDPNGDRIELRVDITITAAGTEEGSGTPGPGGNGGAVGSDRTPPAATPVDARPAYTG